MQSLQEFLQMLSRAVIAQLQLKAVSPGEVRHVLIERPVDLKRLLAWQTLPRAVYSILNSSDISHDRLNSLSGSGVMDSMAFLMPGMKNRTCGGSRVSMHMNIGIDTILTQIANYSSEPTQSHIATLCFAAAVRCNAVHYFRHISDNALMDLRTNIAVHDKGNM